MPSGMMNLVISWDASGIWTGICGVQTKSMFLDTSAPLNVFGVSFKAGGGIPFLPMPNGELHNLQVPLDAVWSVSQARAVSEELSQRRFIDLFREFAGVTPSMYLRFRASRNHVVGHD